MRRAKGVTTRTGSRLYQWQIKVPKDLAGLYSGQWAARVSLETEDLSEANRRAAALELEWLERFATERRQLNPLTVHALTPALLKTIRDSLRYEVLHKDQALRFDEEALREVCLALEDLAPSPVHFAGLAGVARLPDFLDLSWDPFRDISPPQLALLPPAAIARYTRPHWRKLAMLDRLRELQSIISERNTTALLVTGDMDRAKVFADQATRRMGFVIDWARPENRRHLPAILQAATDAWADALSRHNGVAIPTPEEPIGPTFEAEKAPAPTHNIFDALEAWKLREVNRPLKTISKFTNAANRFEALMPGRSLESLTTMDGEELTTRLKQWAHSNGKSQTTAKDNHLCIGAMLRVALKKGWCMVDPLTDTEIKKDETERDAWTPEEIVRLFDHPLFNAYELPEATKAGRDAAYWVPLLSLYTGARLTEMCQLWTDDITDVNGGLVITMRVTPGRGQSLKNASSRRATPVHSELIRLGFGDYWRVVSIGGPRSLFPALPKGGQNNAGGQFGTWFGLFKTGQGFDGTRVFHGFRHTAETELGHAGGTPQQVGAITGHAGKDKVAAGYRKSMPRNAERLRSSIELLQFPELNLPRVFKTPAWKPETDKTAPKA